MSFLDAVENVGRKVIHQATDVIDEATGFAGDAGRTLLATVLDAEFAPDVREDGLSGAEIYRIFHHGNTDSLRTAAADWAKTQSCYDKAREEISTATGSVWPDWEGPAADAARAAIAPFEQSLDAARDAAARISATINAQADWFEYTSNKVHELADKPPFDPNQAQAVLLKGMADKADEYHEKEEANRQYYREYIEASRVNVAALPVFEPVPTIAAASQGVPAGSGRPIESDQGMSHRPAASTVPAASRLAPPTVGATVPSGTADRPGLGTVAGPQPLATTTPPGDVVRPASANLGPARTGTWSTGADRDPHFRAGVPGLRAGDPVPGGGTPGFRSGEPNVRRSTGHGPRTASVMTPPGQLPSAPGTRSGRDDEHRRRFPLDGSDRWQLFGTDEIAAPAVIGGPREKK